MKDLIEKHGAKLKRLTHDKIELVRKWRNDPKISRYMEYREEITPEMQEQWFEKINNDNNLYYIIEADGKEIGLTNIRDIDYEKSIGELGIFIWDDDFLNTSYNFQVAICFLDFCFEELKLKKLFIHVLKDNKRAIKYNKMLGYVLSDNQEDVNNQEYTLTYPQYKIRRKKIERLIK